MASVLAIELALGDYNSMCLMWSVAKHTCTHRTC